MATFHDFKVKDAEGNLISLDKYKGKKVVVFNTASECGYTPQLEQFQELYALYEEQGLEVIAFPCNQFGGQEPGSMDEIVSFCSTHFGVSFPIMGKLDVRGNNADPLFQWLQEKKLNGVADKEITWNFFKFLIDEQGRWYRGYASATEPLGKEIAGWINQTTLF
jgi:glutathione peroxidase